jgi:hypothetical protein
VKSLKGVDSRNYSYLLAKVLSHSWHNTSLLPEISSGELESISIMLQSSGAGGLGWWRIRESDLSIFQVGEELHQAYRLQTLYSARHEHNIQAAFALMRANNIEPILTKGWAIARLYPAKGLRPYGDIDLQVRSEDYSKAQDIAKSVEGQKCHIDLWHEEFARLDKSNIDEIYQRSQLVKLQNADIRILGAEDNLRFLCLHLLRHGAIRPLWFCDVAVALESRPENFDWQYCLGKHKIQADWIACVIGVTHQLLGAQVEGTPIAQRAHNLPKWLVPAILKAWERRYSSGYKPQQLMMDSLRHPGRFMESFKGRWLNPIEASVDFKIPFNEFPRWPFQLVKFMARSAHFITRLPRLLIEKRSHQPIEKPTVNAESKR